jgi:GR25 family glycosyltransferase involved in LPS biosynthesis
MSKYIEHIFYINLDSRTDRNQEIISELDKYGLSYERFSAIPTPGQGILGCTKSHTEVLKLAKSRGYKNVLILEDDFEFMLSKEVFEKELTDFFESGIPFDVCMLSYSIQKSKPVENHANIGQILEAQNAAAYIVNSHYYDKIINLYEWGIPYLASTNRHWIYANDQMWKRLQVTDSWYYIVNRLGHQRGSYSDNSSCYRDVDY